ncbi:MAG TPA: hypothetical protein VG942_07075 [Hyphomonadaceae bacterium]|nr:hypothetical protein [Hyphomonadaceae bacterium]
MGRFGAIAGVTMLAWLGLGPAAMAQDFWTHEGIKFAARDGWCGKEANQGTPAAPSMALEARKCGTDFPYMSAGIAEKDGNSLPGVADLIKNGTTYAYTPDAHKVVMDLMNNQHTGCTESTYVVKTNVMTGVAGFAVEATFACTDSTTPVLFKNWTTYAKTKGGAVWVVAFDYPTASVTGGDIAMIQSAVQTISSAP